MYQKSSSSKSSTSLEKDIKWLKIKKYQRRENFEAENFA